MKSTLTTILFAVFASNCAFAQTDAGERDCTKKANSTVVVDHPGKVTDAINLAVAQCMRDKQLRQIALYRGAQVTCGESADERVKLKPEEDRVALYSICMRGHGYVQ
jgi:hypothetical protein